MKDPSLAPAFAALYPTLCKAAREYGYALAIHGTLQRDMDLIAVPWTDTAMPSDELVEALIGVSDGWIIHRAEGNDLNDGTSPKQKPHGRVAWSIYISEGVYLDLSVMPLLTAFIKEQTQ